MQWLKGTQSPGASDSPNSHSCGEYEVYLKRILHTYGFRLLMRVWCCRYGIWGDWEEPYLTLDPAFEAEQLRVFAKMVLNGHIYRGKKPVVVRADLSLSTTVSHSIESSLCQGLGRIVTLVR